MSARRDAVNTFVIDPISKTVFPSRVTPGAPAVPAAKSFVCP
jgi:hypothetical protein